MENMAGGSLATAIQNKALSPTSKNCTIISLVKGVGHLHANKILHRDLKPANVLFTAEGFAKIGDFGSAFAVGSNGVSQTTRGGKTIAYSSPECLEGAHSSEASDIWALGLTIYEILSGDFAFDSSLSLAALLRAVSGPTRPAVPAGARPALKAVIARCWDADPTKRMTIVEIDELLSSVEWALVEGAELKVVKAFLAEFPLEETASTGHPLKAEVAILESENTELKSEVARLRAENTRVTSENSQLQSEVSGRDWEIASLRRELAQLRATRPELAQLPVRPSVQGSIPGKPPAAGPARVRKPNGPAPAPSARRPQVVTLLALSQMTFEGLGVSVANAKLLMKVKTGPFDMKEFVTKVVNPGLNPTLLLLEWKPGYVVGGFAAVPWPEGEDFCYAADPQRKSFIFSLEPNAARFDLLNADKALKRARGKEGRAFYFGRDVVVVDGGTCWSEAGSYAERRDEGTFPNDSGDIPFTRFEVWAL
jgi:hypothetical protein